MISKFFSWLKSLIPQKPSQYIHSISFKDSHGTDFTFTIGDEFIINDETKGTIEKIQIRNSEVTTHCDSFIVKHTMHKEASFILKPVDENAALRDALRKLVASAKQRSIVNPILANEVIKELAMEKK